VIFCGHRLVLTLSLRAVIDQTAIKQCLRSSASLNWRLREDRFSPTIPISPFVHPRGWAHPGHGSLRSKFRTHNDFLLSRRINTAVWLVGWHIAIIKIQIRHLINRFKWIKIPRRVITSALSGFLSWTSSNISLLSACYSAFDRNFFVIMFSFYRATLC